MEEASVFWFALFAGARFAGARNVSIGVSIARGTIVEAEDPAVEFRTRVMTGVVAQIGLQENMNVHGRHCEARCISERVPDKVL